MRRPAPTLASHRPGRLVPALLVAMVSVVAGCGDSGDPGGPAATTSTTVGSTSTTVRGATAAPRWETVSTLAGSGNQTTAAFTILDDAIQWRVRWKCSSGHLRVMSDPPPPRRPDPAVDEACTGADATPAKAIGYGIVTGSVKLVVEATSAWELTVDQQLDTPLLEPPLPGMDTAKVLGQGEFYDVEMKGEGTARLYQLADGSRALRLEDFEVSSNTDLFVWLSESPNPRTSKDAVDSPYVVLGGLKSTLGSENYVLPPDLSPDRIRSIVIWCAPVQIAYTAAVLAPPA